MTILPQLERDLDAAADRHLPSREAPGLRRRGQRFGAGVAIAVSVATAIVVTVVALSLRHGPARRAHRGSNLVAVGMPVPIRSVKAGAGSGVLQLQAVGLGRSSHVDVLATLLKPVPREPDDVCFYISAAIADPAADDVACSVQGHGRLVSVIGSNIPGAGPLSYVVGQAPSDVIRVELIGLGGSRELRLSGAHMFLAAFAQAARGRMELRATLSDGQTLTNAFALPLSSAQIQAFSDRYRRPGAVFNGEIDENIVGSPYREIVKRFGPPLATLGNRLGQRCVYYDVVGYENGWSFCFKHGTMTSAGGNQTPPPGVH
jgi:hypothetical protein